MQFFECTQCHQLVYFENSTCLNCGSALVYAPLSKQMVAVEPDGAGTWRVIDDHDRRFSFCQNSLQYQVCNWAVPIEDPNPYCRSCRLNEIIPDLSVAGNVQAWAKLEKAKRRLLHGLTSLGLAVRSREADPENGLGFRFLADDLEEKVMTGHDAGVITLNIAEARDSERERRREQLSEPYRTLLGHFRHEIGHYYWNLLILHGDRLEGFRKLFGDERRNYQKALKTHYAQGPPANWQNHFISAYSTMHPWEDWAESWAHYLHMRDTLETAAACGVTVHLPETEPRSLKLSEEAWSFDRVKKDWLLLTHVLNNLNRGLGQPDSYPFVISPGAAEKLRFIHDVICENATATAA